MTKYTITRNGQPLTEVSGSATAFVDTSAAGATAYTYTVRAADASGNQSAASTGANVTTPAGGTTSVTFNPTADAHTSSKKPNNNFGTITTLDVRARPQPADDFKAHLKFAVSGVSGTITSAKLRVWNTSASNASTRSVCAYPDASSTWTETGITWNNQPASGAQLSCVAGNQAVGYIEYPVTGRNRERHLRLQSLPEHGDDRHLLESRGRDQQGRLVVATAAAADTLAPSTPSGLTASAVSDKQINLAWTASTDNVGVQGYKVREERRGRRDRRQPLIQ